MEKQETVEEFLARGGKIKEVCKGMADKIAYNTHHRTSRFHFTERTTKKEIGHLINIGERTLGKAYQQLKKKKEDECYQKV